jgi:hypothetical protein
MHIGAGASHQRYGDGGNPKAHQFLSGCPCSHFAGQTMALTTRGSYHDLEREMEFDSGKRSQRDTGSGPFRVDHDFRQQGAMDWTFIANF